MLSPTSLAHAVLVPTHFKDPAERLLKTIYSENYKPIRHEDVDRAITDKGNG